jgi:hypothetical protein
MSQTSAKQIQSKIDRLDGELREQEATRLRLETEVQNSTEAVLPSGLPKTQAMMEMVQIMIKGFEKKKEMTALRSQLPTSTTDSKPTREVDPEAYYEYFGFERKPKQLPTEWTKVQYPHVQESVWRAMMGLTDVVLRPAVINAYHTRFPGKHSLSRCLLQMSPGLLKALTSLSGSNGVSLMAQQIQCSGDKAIKGSGNLIHAAVKARVWYATTYRGLQCPCTDE